MIFKPTLFFGLAAVFAAGLPLSAELHVRLVPGAEGMLTATLTNRGDRTVRFLRHETPLANEFEASLFRINRGGKDVAYLGKQVMRTGVGPEDWIELAPGESIQRSLDLAANYDLSEAGAYAVRFERSVPYRTVDSRRGRQTLEATASSLLSEEALAQQVPDTAEQVDSNEIEVFVSLPRIVSLEAAQDRGSATGERAGGNIWNNCSSSWQASIGGDKPVAESLAYRSYSLLYSKPTAQRPTYASYKTWYGTYAASNYTTAQNNFARIYNSFAQTWTVRCNIGCQPNWGAYVYKSQTYIVTICSGYFSLSGSARASILLHEASHWSAIANTNDYTYGYTNCQNLAKSSPSSALYNADSYRYFSLYAQ